MKTFPALFFLVITALCLCAAHGQDVCGNYTNCESCTNSTGCIWALLYNCTERCLNWSYREPNEIYARKHAFRGFTRTQSQCNYLDSCQIIEYGVMNPSFEFPFDPNYCYGSEVRKESGNISKIYNSFDMALDGNNFIFMGGRPENYRTQVYDVTMLQIIEKNATHLM